MFQIFSGFAGMVLHFPSKLTEEEEQLQAKYAKLRRKKKQLQDVTKPKQEPEHSKIKKPSEAKDAKEVAKKLLKTGAIKAIKKSLEKEKAKDEKVGVLLIIQVLTCPCRISGGSRGPRGSRGS